MLAETMLAAALAYTGGVAINDSPSNALEGISGCAAYSHTTEQEACVERVALAWAYGATPSPHHDHHVPHYQVPHQDRDYGDTPESVVEDAAPTPEPEWTPPSWCEDTQTNLEYVHPGITDWDIATEDWTDEQVEFCFPDI